GLKGEYFSNNPSAVDFPAGVNLVRLDPTINFNWGGGSPAAGISVDAFKVRWTGKLIPLTTEVYTIYTIASDGIRVWINDNLVIDSWTDKPVTSSQTTIALDKSRSYDIRVEYYSNINSSSCILQWSSSSLCRQIIPASQLFANAK